MSGYKSKEQIKLRKTKTKWKEQSKFRGKELITSGCMLDLLRRYGIDEIYQQRNNSPYPGKQSSGPNSQLKRTKMQCL